MRRQLVYVIGIVAVAAAGVVYTVLVGNEPLLGLDLQGGASVVLEPTRAAEPDELDVAVAIIRNRVDGLGVAEPEISTQGGNILVQLPGVNEQQRALDLVGQTAQLRFRPVLSVLSESAFEGVDSEEPLLALYALTEGEAAADAEVVLPHYDDDRNVVFRYRLGPTAGRRRQSRGRCRPIQRPGWYRLVRGTHVQAGTRRHRPVQRGELQMPRAATRRVPPGRWP